MEKLIHDFSGWATKYNIKCTDGRTILPGAFEHMDKQVVPLVWQHGHSDVSNVLGHGLFEDRPEGLYMYGFLNDSSAAQHAKSALQHKDITSISIWANQLVEKSKRVAHGMIREASLVLSGANPGALIDFVAIQHDDGTIMESSDEAIIHSGMDLTLFEPSEDDDDVYVEHEGIMIHADRTVADVFETLNDEQKTIFYAMAAELIGGGDEMQQGEDLYDEGETMKTNVFESKDVDPKKDLLHANFSEINTRAKELGSLKAAVQEAGIDHIEHATTYGIGSDRDNLELLFPDARGVTKEPTWISRRMEWVSSVLGGTKHTPFSRIKSLHADITADEARARGYITGNLKVEEVFSILRRITTPTTIYKKQKLDRDDILDITDFDVVRWLKGEMRVMLDEEIARAILVSDGRDPIAEVDDHINTDNIRPIYGDSAVYVHYAQVAADHTADDLIDDIITARIDYRGSGNPTCFVSPAQLNSWLLLKDGDGRRLYRTVSELAQELRVNRIVEVPVMDGLSRTPDEDEYELRAIILNLNDYVVGADKGGEINFFDDFDIDYNQYKYLLETRISGALIVPKGAIVLEQLAAD